MHAYVDISWYLMNVRTYEILYADQSAGRKGGTGKEDESEDEDDG